MTDSPVPLTKSLLRDRARQLRLALPAEQRAVWSADIRRHLLHLLDGDDPVMIYVSKPLEVDTREVIRVLLSQKKRIIVPIIEKETRNLRLSYLEGMADLVESTFSVPEPVGNEHPAEARDVTSVIVPLLAFDRKGHRLGYGAGYSDRFLSANPHLRIIGLAFSCLEAGSVPADDHDIGMDIVVTENGIIRCRQDAAGA